MDNFREMSAEFLAAGAGAQVRSGEELGRFWCKLIENPARAEQMGQAARALVERNRGATERSLAPIVAILDAQRSRV